MVDLPLWNLIYHNTDMNSPWRCISYYWQHQCFSASSVTRLYKWVSWEQDLNLLLCIVVMLLMYVVIVQSSSNLYNYNILRQYRAPLFPLAAHTTLAGIPFSSQTGLTRLMLSWTLLWRTPSLIATRPSSLWGITLVNLNYHQKRNQELTIDWYSTFKLNQ